MRKSVLKIVAAVAALAISAGANATVFNISLPTPSSFTLSGTITTDNTIGALSIGNITAYNLTATSGANTLNCTNISCVTNVGGVLGSAFSATATQLTWNFSTSPQPQLVFTPTAGGKFICFGPGGGLCNFGSGNGVTYFVGGSTYAVQNYAGVQIIGTSTPVGPAVPEPATWGMMLAGFGIVGAAMRRRNVLALV
jgi:PEP-CTERM motif